MIRMDLIGFIQAPVSAEGEGTCLQVLIEYKSYSILVNLKGGMPEPIFFQVNGPFFFS